MNPVAAAVAATVVAARIAVPRFAAGVVLGVLVVGAIAALIVGNTVVRVVVACGLVFLVVFLLRYAVTWFSMRRHRRSIRLEVDGEAIELAGASDEDLAQLVTQFLARQGVALSPEQEQGLHSQIHSGQQSQSHRSSVEGQSYALAPVAAQPRGVPYWLQVASPLVGIVTGIGGMIIALAK